jgi:hypothetical protein
MDKFSLYFNTRVVPRTQLQVLEKIEFLIGGVSRRWYPIKKDEPIQNETWLMKCINEEFTKVHYYADIGNLLFKDGENIAIHKPFIKLKSGYIFSNSEIANKFTSENVFKSTPDSVNLVKLGYVYTERVKAAMDHINDLISEFEKAIGYEEPEIEEV